MSDYRFTVLDVVAEPYAVSPQLTARLRIDETTGVRVHAIALRCQVRIDPQRRHYDDAEQSALLGLFGERARWGDTLKPFTWMQCNTTVPGFEGHTEADLALPCTYDLDVIGTRYLHALGAGDVPLTLLFSGTVFTRGETGFAVERVPWACEASHALPVAVWRQMIESYFPNSGWLRLDAGTLAELAGFRARHGLISWDETIHQLLGGRAMTIEAARAVADAVLYEGYLLYPYRASSTKNRSRWQFGVLGPPHAAASAFAEAPNMAMQCLVTPGGQVTVRLRFLHLQVRDVERPTPPGLIPSSATVAADEAVEHEITLPPFTGPPLDFPVTVPGFSSIEPGARRRWPLTARVRVHADADDDLLRLTVTVTNEHPGPIADKASATRHSLLGAHLLLEATGASFVSVVDPPPPFAAAAGRCHQDRCWPVLAGSNSLLLGAPIILYDHPQIAPESPGPLFDLTEIDEILTLRVMTMTDAEKAEARATDPRAAAIIDRCDAMAPAELARLHGARRTPSPAPSAVSLPSSGETPWWDPAADASVDPARDTVDVAGTPVGKDSLVRLRPSRRADAQDLFLAGRLARVTAVLSDVDGGSHVAVVLADDPDSDLHDWYGRYYYFAPDELEPAGAATGGENPS